MEIRLERGEPCACRQTTLPAELFRRIRHQLRRQQGRSVFIPIRSMQYLAVIDEEEVVFVDGMVKHRIEIAWRAFRPQDCAAVGDPVPFEECHYSPAGQEMAPRLLREFSTALRSFEERTEGTPDGLAAVVPLIVRGGDPVP
ncbi:MAG: hypothetical protein D6717_02155 [Gammaproteobacteria bacterium]|nr:MAG: hypothetical protein D6717_02155 [Gammaproteobacteria bacterium]